MSNRENWDDTIEAIKVQSKSVNPPAELKNKVMELFLSGAEGEKLAEIRVDSLQAEDDMDRILSELMPGMGKAIYIADGSGEKKVSQQTNYKPVEWAGSLHELETESHIPLRVPDYIQLHCIEAVYGFDNITEAEMDEMYEEAARTGKTVVTRDLRPSGQTVGVVLHGLWAGQSLQLHGLTTTKSRIHVPDVESHYIERLNVAGHEAIFLQGGGMGQLMWVQQCGALGQKTAVQYELRASNMNKELLMKLACEIAALAK